MTTTPELETARRASRLGRFVKKHWLAIIVGLSFVVGLAVLAYFGMRIIF